jgi:hypothetical protein
MLKNAVDLADG